MMSSSDFDAFETNNNNTTGAKSDGNPLEVFDSNDNGAVFGGAAGDGLGAPAPANPSSDVDLAFGTGAAADTNNDAYEGEMEEHKLNDDDPNYSDDDDDEDEESVGDNLLDMEGWNLRGEESNGNTQTDAGEEYAVEASDTDLMAANAKGERNNSRRGLFGGFNRGKQQGESNDLLSSDTATSPSWSNASNNSSSGKGNGFFGRRSNNATPPAKSFDHSSNDSDTSSYSKVPRDGIDEAGLAYGEGGITGDVTEDTILEKEIQEEQERMDNELRPGDHIFIWQGYGINPRAYQRHAVVFSVTKGGEGDPLSVCPPQGPSSGRHGEEPLSFDADALYTDQEDDVEVTVVSFYHLQGNRRGKRSGCKRELLYDFIGPDGILKKKPIHKVRYGRKVKKGLLSQKAGVGTALKKDQVGLVLARVQYVLDNPDHLPTHNALSANGECASLWCVTGRWCTLQGASILAIMSVGQAGGALLAGGILSNLTLLVPMPGVWGLAGWWWYVPATVAYPFLVPMLVALGMCSLVPLEILRRNRKKWRAITDVLNHAFWSGTTEAIKEEFFGVMATAEKEAELRSFFGVREGDKGSAADDAKYMPVGGAPDGVDDDDDEDEALAMQQMEQSCQNMASDMDVDLSGRPPSESSPKGSGAWGSFMGSFRKKDSSREELTETQRFHTSY
eukprot:CAMPEP_0172300624 /NCGR_PEP_ID=MMETSP1058-20130122/2661_1 /TAXON_ID=83371 /ORGANISM="Detonula confervacea, Strain CCMP 353" /LENGTH=673 /DNA_ID=CAMNT_0013010447 /DNA_START=13 /DNA_END=2034 /DNA_ORIENTATION=+